MSYEGYSVQVLLLRRSGPLSYTTPTLQYPPGAQPSCVGRTSVPSSAASVATEAARAGQA